MNRRNACLAILAGVAMLAGCPMVKSPRDERRDKAFEQAITTYRKLIRWGYFEEASQYLKGKDLLLEKPDFTAYARYKVSSYSTGEQLVSNNGDEARVIAHVEFYDVDTRVAKSMRDEQYWWYDREEERWYLGSPMLVLYSGPVAREISR